MRRGVGLLFALLVISTGVAPPAYATFPGSNGKIAFTLHGRRSAHIGVVDADGTNLTILDPSPRRYDRDPSWSSDGGTIVFQSSTVRRHAKIQTIAPDGTDRTVIYEGRHLGLDIVRPVWSPDDTMIAFCVQPSLSIKSQIFTMNADGSSVTNISGTDHRSDCYPDWSPDGTRIAFEANGNVITMNVDGSGRTVVCPGYRPSWSPDGQMIAFERGHYYDRRIFVADADGSNVEQLTGSSRPIEQQAAFSPDGTMVAFTRRKYPDYVDIFTVTLADLSITRVTETQLAEFAPTWQPT